MADYDHLRIANQRQRGVTWQQIADEYDRDESTVRQVHTGWQPEVSIPQTAGMAVLGIDIETAPHKVYVWGTRKQYINVDQMIESGRVMCFSARWFSDDKQNSTMFLSEYSDGHKPMIWAAWQLLHMADAVVHYNGSKFDIPMLNREFIKYELDPPATFKEVDLLKTARRKFKFNSNKLDNVLDELGLGRKVSHEGFRLWVKCMEDADPDAWQRMEEYNRADVNKMEELYERLLPWISRHPNHALYRAADQPLCPNCGSHKLVSNGYRRTKTQRYRRLQCQECGTWVRERYTDVLENERHNILVQA